MFMSFRPLFPVFRLLAAVVAIGANGPAVAQIQLQGAIGGGQPGNPIEQGVAVRAPNESSVIGRQLRHNGANGRLAFEKHGADFVISRLVLSGEKISGRSESCEIEVTGGPFVLRPMRRLEGLRRFEAAIPACPFTIEILDGAVQINIGDATSSTPNAGYCEFKAADCRGSLAGLWGPAGAAMSPADIAQNERMRGLAEKNAQANYRALIASAGKDRAKVRMTASEQAGFSSRRTERCEDYAGEARHGFCASRLTDAWAIALRARQNPAAFEAEEAHTARKPAPARGPAMQLGAPVGR